jgi:hypothetical protein
MPCHKCLCDNGATTKGEVCAMKRLTGLSVVAYALIVSALAGCATPAGQTSALTATPTSTLTPVTATATPTAIALSLLHVPSGWQPFAGLHFALAHPPDLLEETRLPGGGAGGAQCQYGILPGICDTLFMFNRADKSLPLSVDVAVGVSGATLQQQCAGTPITFVGLPMWESQLGTGELAWEFPSNQGVVYYFRGQSTVPTIQAEYDAIWATLNLALTHSACR